MLKKLEKMLDQREREIVKLRQLKNFLDFYREAHHERRQKVLEENPHCSHLDFPSYEKIEQMVRSALKEDGLIG